VAKLLQQSGEPFFAELPLSSWPAEQSELGRTSS
jgi:hypothetical protein